MKKYYKFMLALLAVLLLTGCTDTNKATEQYKTCIADYIERSGFDLTFEVKDSYETAEDTYLEIIRLAFWQEEKAEQFEEVFNFWHIQFDDIASAFIKEEKLYWADVEKYFTEETAVYQAALEEAPNNYLREILEASSEEIQAKQEKIYSDLQNGRLEYVRKAEYYRKNADYGKMFLEARAVDTISDMYYELYPKEFYQAALDYVYKDTSMGGIEEAKEFFIEIGEYDKYADDIEYKYYWTFESWRCDNGTCKEWGGYTVKGHSGEYCWRCAKRIEDGGPYNKKKPLPFKGDDPEAFNGNQAGPDLGYSGGEEAGSSNKNPSSSKPNKDKNEKPYDPYDVYDYDDPEDFYYDWEDDFDGYEDAEDYWYDAWDEVD